MTMFSVLEVPAGDNSILQFREEILTGFRCRISPGRINRTISRQPPQPSSKDDCPFCQDRIYEETPLFADQGRILLGESVTFPNKFPFAEWHTVTVISRSHSVERFTARQLSDAFTSQITSLLSADGYPSINWNYLPSAGASLSHPHLQGLVDRRPPPIMDRYMEAGERYRAVCGRDYWRDWCHREEVTPRYLFGDEIKWFAHAVPLGEREVRGFLPIISLAELDPYTDVLVSGILEIIEMYRLSGTAAFNLSLFFGKNGTRRGISAFCSIIARINPNSDSASDTTFMERIHLDPVILTMPEQLGEFYRKEKKKLT
jgi:UDPglucose--hexose-1-phosphate uridylyltransferase